MVMYEATADCKPHFSQNVTDYFSVALRTFLPPGVELPGRQGPGSVPVLINVKFTEFFCLRVV